MCFLPNIIDGKYPAQIAPVACCVRTLCSAPQPLPAKWSQSMKMKSPLTSHYKPTSTSAPILSLFPLLVLEKSSLLLSKTSPSTYAPDPIPSRTLVNIAYCLPPLFPTPLINLSPQSAISLKTNSGLFHLLTYLPSPNT